MTIENRQTPDQGIGSLFSANTGAVASIETGQPQNPTQEGAVAATTNAPSPVVSDASNSPSDATSNTVSPAPTPNTPASSQTAAMDAGTAAASAGNDDGNGVNAPDSSPVSTAALAGGVVAALVVGLLLGAVIGILWKRRRTSRRGRKTHLDKDSPINKAPVVTARSISDSGSDDASSWHIHLPQPADDSSLRRSVKTIFHQIDQHVENFYSDNANDTRAVANSPGLEFYETDALPLPLSEALRCAHNKKAVVKHAMTYFILTRIDPECSPVHSFLPPALSALPSTVAEAAAHSANANTTSADKRVFNEAYAQYRVLTGYLISTVSTTPSDGAEQHYRTAATHFTTAFATCLTSAASHQSTVENLIDIIRHAAAVGRLLATQPNRFRFLWAQAPGVPSAVAVGGTQQVLVFQVTPTVVKVTDAAGRWLGTPAVLVPGVDVGGGGGGGGERRSG